MRKTDATEDKRKEEGVAGENLGLQNELTPG